MRVTDAQNSTQDQHQYSRRSAFTADGACYILNNGQIIYLDGPLCGQIKCTVPTSSEFVASCTNPDLFFGISGGQFLRYDCSTNATTVLASGVQSTLGGFEGQGSWDDRYFPLMNAGGSTVSVIDVTQPAGSNIVSTNVGQSINWADISPNGTYLIVGTSGGPVYRYDLPGLTNQTALNVQGRDGNFHYDLLFDAAGNEVLVGEGFGSAGSQNQDFGYNILSSNTWVPVDVVLNGNAIAGMIHVSGQAKNRPGYVYVTGDNPNFANSPQYYTGAFELVPGQTQVEDWGSSFASGNSGYLGEGKGTASADGTMLAISTDWGNSGAVYDFVYRVANVVMSECQVFYCEYNVTSAIDPNECDPDLIQCTHTGTPMDGTFTASTPANNGPVTLTAQPTGACFVVGGVNQTTITLQPGSAVSGEYKGATSQITNADGFIERTYRWCDPVKACV